MGTGGLFPRKCIRCRKIFHYLKCGLCSGCFRTMDPQLRSKGSLNYLFNFTPDFQRIMHAAKYGRQIHVLHEMTAHLGRELKKTELPFGVITWVPMHTSDLGKRGDDQGKVIATVLAEELGFPCVCLLKKIRKNKRQAGLSRKERSRNVQGVYQCICKTLSGQTVYLVDDVYTTGSTLRECRRQLETANPSWIQFLTLACVEEFIEK